MRTPFLAASLVLFALGASCTPAATPVQTNTNATNTVVDTNTTVVEPVADLITLNTPYSTQVYDLSYASTFLANLEILNASESSAMYTQVFTPLVQSAVSLDRTAIFLGRYVQAEGLESEYYVVHPESGTATILKNQSCLGMDGYWQGNTLITYATSELDQSGELPTNVCFWNTDGELLGTIRPNLYWSAAASAPYLSDAIGIVPNAPELQAWTYTEQKPGTCIVTTYSVELGESIMNQEILDATLSGEEIIRCRPAQFKFNFAKEEGGVHLEASFLDDLVDPIDAVRNQGSLD